MEIDSLLKVIKMTVTVPDETPITVGMLKGLLADALERELQMKREREEEHYRYSWGDFET